VLVVTGGLLAGLAPLALKAMVDTVAAPIPQAEMSWRETVAFAAASLAALCANQLLTELRPTLLTTAEQRVYARLRNRFFAHLLELPLAFHRDRQSGAHAQALQQAVLGSSSTSSTACSRSASRSSL